jgi:hypothetical protein
MSKTAAEVIEEIFAAAELAAESAPYTAALRQAWEAEEWSDQKIATIVHVGGSPP